MSTSLSFRQGANYDIWGRTRSSIIYASVDELRNRLNNEADDYEEVLIEQLRTASRMIDQYTRRAFYPYECTYYLASSTYRLSLPDELLSFVAPGCIWYPGLQDGLDLNWKWATEADTPTEGQRDTMISSEVLDEVLLDDPDFLNRAQEYWYKKYHPTNFSNVPDQPPPPSFNNRGALGRIPFGLTSPSVDYSHNRQFYLHPTFPPHSSIQIPKIRDPLRTSGLLGNRVRYEYAVRGIYGAYDSPVPPALIKWATLYIAQSLQQLSDIKEFQVEMIEWNQILYQYLGALKRPPVGRIPAIL